MSEVTPLLMVVCVLIIVAALMTFTMFEQRRVVEEMVDTPPECRLSDIVSASVGEHFSEENFALIGTFLNMYAPQVYVALMGENPDFERTFSTINDTLAALLFNIRDDIVYVQALVARVEHCVLEQIRRHKVLGLLNSEAGFEKFVSRILLCLDDTFNHSPSNMMAMTHDDLYNLMQKFRLNAKNAMYNSIEGEIDMNTMAKIFTSIPQDRNQYNQKLQQLRTEHAAIVA